MNQTIIQLPPEVTALLADIRAASLPEFQYNKLVDLILEDEVETALELFTKWKGNE